MSIVFVHAQQAFLPELEAYHRFFTEYGIPCDVVHPKDLSRVNRKVEWFMMGTDFSPRTKGITRIHEYASPSVTPARHVKDFIKTHFTTRPHFRLFLNGYVRNRLPFLDKIPYGWRDMGIHADQITHTDLPATLSEKKEFDFIYIGDLSPQRKPEVLLQAFTRPDLRTKNLLILSHHYETLQEKYKAYTNITFWGPVPRSQVAGYIQCSRFGLNYMPDVRPFNQLTSTKLLEYAACGLPMISTDYAWVRKFQQQYGGNCLLVQDNWQDLTWEKAIGFDYQLPDLRTWTWEHQIRHSGVLPYIEAAFAGVKF